MSQKSSVDRAEMAQAAQRVESAAQDLRKIKGDLGSEQAQLSGRWIGEAGSAFTKVFNEFDGELNKVLEALGTVQGSRPAVLREQRRGKAQRQVAAVPAGIADIDAFR